MRPEKTMKGEEELGRIGKHLHEQLEDLQKEVSNFDRFVELLLGIATMEDTSVEIIRQETSSCFGVIILTDDVVGQMACLSEFNFISNLILEKTKGRDLDYGINFHIEYEPDDIEVDTYVGVY